MLIGSHIIGIDYGGDNLYAGSRSAIAQVVMDPFYQVYLDAVAGAEEALGDAVDAALGTYHDATGPLISAAESLAMDAYSAYTDGLSHAFETYVSAEQAAYNT